MRYRDCAHKHTNVCVVLQLSRVCHRFAPLSADDALWASAVKSEPKLRSISKYLTTRQVCLRVSFCLHVCEQAIRTVFETEAKRKQDVDVAAANKQQALHGMLKSERALWLTMLSDGLASACVFLLLCFVF